MVIKFPELVSPYSNSAISTEVSVAHFVTLFMYSIYGSENICDVIIKRTVMATKLKTAKKNIFTLLFFKDQIEMHQCI